jgi:hypothetical protein
MNADHHGAPTQHRPTRVRQLLQWAERLRYGWEYRFRVRELLRAVQPGHSVKLSRREGKMVRDFWRRYGINFINLDWYRLFKGLNGSVDERYIPEEIFRTRIEPLLCRRDVSAAYHDKNQLDRLFCELRRPTTILRNIYGNYYDTNYQPVNREHTLAFLRSSPGAYFLKPAISGTGSGHNVVRLVIDPDGLHLDGRRLELREVEKVYVQDFLVQEGVPQHAAVARFHPTSLNTIRLITLRLNNSILPLAATFRMGNGSYVDNGHAGGLLCGVKIDSGLLTDFACDVAFRHYECHPFSGIRFAGQQIPSMSDIVAMAVAAHSRLLYFDQISCDIAVLPDGAPCLIEVNTFGQGVEPHQYLKGGPLFGEQTDEVLALVHHRAQCGWNE